jgi:RNA polymerase sigma-70 factor (ECF subfamily)
VQKTNPAPHNGAPASPPAAAAPWATDHAANADERQRLWRYLRALGADAAEADDLAQEAMLVAHQRALQPAAGDASVQAAFVRGVARNLWLRSRRWWHRRREREVAIAVDELWDATAAHDGGDELLARLRDCLGALQPRVRRALELHYHDGLGWRAIAAALAMKANGVKTLLQRARQTLRKCLERNER